MSTNNITNLDFETIKSNLITYLKSQDRFKDYNFAGSNLNVLLDVLAYNTFQNGFYTNMAVNESFLDTAQLRGSVLSHAKALNYVPRSKKSSQAKIRLTLTVNDDPAFITVPANTRFIAKCGNKTYTFFTNQAETIVPNNGVYSIDELDIYEGISVQEFYKVVGTTQKYIISNTGVDTNSLKVFIKKSSSATEEDEYLLKHSVFGSTNTSKVFYVQAYNDNQYELIFGQNNFGIEPANGWVVRCTYRIASGEEANGITSFAPDGNIAGYPATVSLVSASEGGFEAEDVSSIKYFAPRSIQIQDRAITESDYEYILKTKFPEIQAISVYGGEELNPPRYGRVVIAVDVKNAEGVSENNKTKYTTYLKERAPIAIEPLLVSPKFMFVSVVAQIQFNTKTTSMSEAAIREVVVNEVLKYNDSALNNFKTTFRYSKLSSVIDGADKNILSNNLNILPIIPLNPILGVAQTFDFTFNNPLYLDNPLREGDNLDLHNPAIKSSTFTFGNSLAFIQDDGKGVLTIIKKSGDSFVFLNKNIGTVNYETGRTIIKGLNVKSYAGSELKIFGKMRTQTVTSPKDRILVIRKEDIVLDVVGV